MHLHYGTDYIDMNKHYWRYQILMITYYNNKINECVENWIYTGKKDRI